MKGLAIILFMIGIFQLLVPRASWVLSVGRKIRNAEPSDGYLMVSRLSGGLACIVAVILFLAGVIGHQDPSKVYREALKNNKLVSITMQGHIVSESDQKQIKAWILQSNWEKPQIDYSSQNFFSAKGEINLHLDGNQQITVFIMDNSLFGLSNNHLYPEIVFKNQNLKIWVANHLK